MKILFVALKYDYGDPARGTSFEHNNFYDTLSRMPEHQVVYFPFDERLHTLGRDRMNDALLRAVEDERPHLAFFFLFRDEITPRTIEQITQRRDLMTMNWFADDQWRWFNFSRHWAPLFRWVVTTDAQAVARYHRIGYHNVIRSQFACNHFTYKPSSGAYEHDVTFVGLPHSNRRAVVDVLEKAGVRVECWGQGWPNGRIGQEEMIKLFSRSKINLGFAQSSGEFGLKPLAGTVLRRREDRSLGFLPPGAWWDNLRSLVEKRRTQMKGRNFEIPGAGGFLLTGAVQTLEEYYVPEKEIAVFASPNELIEKIRFYLAHEREREEIRQAGYMRTLREHTYVHRFRSIFQAMGLPS